MQCYLRMTWCYVKTHAKKQKSSLNYGGMKIIENKGLRVSRSKTEYLPPSSCHDNVKLGGEEIKTVTTFKYLGSMFDEEGGTTTDCKNRVRLAWNKWREVTGVICDKKVPVKLKHKIYRTVIRPTMTYGADCWTMKKEDEKLMNKTEMRMLRWIQCVSLREHKINEDIREAATVQPITTHLMQKRLLWYSHVSRRDDSHMTRTVLDMVVEGVIPSGFRPGKSCTSQLGLLNLAEHIEDGYEKRLITAAVFVDLSASYDTVNHRRLLNMVLEMTGDVYLSDLIRTMLENRRFFVVLNGKKSRWRPQRNILPQESVLAPVLLCIASKGNYFNNNDASLTSSLCTMTTH